MDAVPSTATRPQIVIHPDDDAGNEQKTFHSPNSSVISDDGSNQSDIILENDR